MYKLTRQEVADKLKISTRSVDRYIKSGKLRAKKEGKVVYVKQADVVNLLGGTETKQEVIIEGKPEYVEKTNTVAKKSNENVAGTLGTIYKDLKEEIQKKDHIIQNLAMRVGKSEEVAKNSVSLLDFKKSQYLLVESKENVGKELTEAIHEKEKIEKELKYEKRSNVILIIFVVILLIAAGIVWYMKI